jgi:hypothetical protein
MFKLFGLESKIVAAVGSLLERFQQDVAGKFMAHDKRITISIAQFDKLKMEMTSRLSRLEVLFADELLAKEKARDLLVKKKRLKSGN